MQDTEKNNPVTCRHGGRGWICTGCQKAITSRPFGSCQDCGNNFRRATEEDLQCDRCGDDDGRRLLDRTGGHDRLCSGCIDEVFADA